MDRCKWRKMIKDVRSSGWVWVGECFFWYRPTRIVLDSRPLNGCVRVCVCVCMCNVDQSAHLATSTRSIFNKIWMPRAMLHKTDTYASYILSYQPFKCQCQAKIYTAHQLMTQRKDTCWLQIKKDIPCCIKMLKQTKQFKPTAKKIFVLLT